MPESGFGLLVAWCAWPRSYGVPIESQRLTVTYTSTDVEPHVEVRSREIQAMVDHDIGSFLKDAGIQAPQEPRDWYVRRPPGLTPVTFWGAINSQLAMQPDGAVTPAQQRRVIESVLAELYST
jgi:hypothetical protein